MSLKLITPPATEPITLAQAKAHLRVEISDDDALITALIAAAREAVESKTQRSLMPQTWELGLNMFPSGDGCVIRLPKAPLHSLVNIKYLDVDGILQTMGEEEYILNDHSEPARIVPSYQMVFPVTRAHPNAVLIRYEAGYPDAASVPAQIKTWMLLRIGTLYENRESIVNGTISQDLAGGFVDRMLDAYKIWGY